MKKTIIAAAVAASVAAPAAFADVTISGMVNPEFSKDNQSDLYYWTEGDLGKNTDSDWVSSVNTDLVFKASDDLGNGMKATAKYHLFHDDGKANGNGHADMSVTLSGDFGAIVAGRMEPLIEGAFDAYANIDASHDLDLEGQDVMNRTTVGTGGLAYVSPNMNGVSVAVSNVSNGDFSAANEVLVKYSNGGINLMAINSDFDAGDTNATGFAAGYKMGDLELRAMTRDGKTDDIDTDYTMIGAKYTMGANTFAIGYAQEDFNDIWIGDLRDIEAESYILSASHALSKNTSVYVTYKDTSYDFTYEDFGTYKETADTDTLLFGLKQTF
jgi:predicted porin